MTSRGVVFYSFAEYFAEFYGSVGARLAFLMMPFSPDFGLFSWQGTTGQFRRRETAIGGWTVSFSTVFR